MVFLVNGGNHSQLRVVFSFDLPWVDALVSHSWFVLNLTPAEEARGLFQNQARAPGWIAHTLGVSYWLWASMNRGRVRVRHSLQYTNAIHGCRLKTKSTACFNACSAGLFYTMNYFELNLLAMKTKKWFLIGSAIAGVYLFMHWDWTAT